MQYAPYDSSGTDDDLPLPHQSSVARAGFSNASGRTSTHSFARARNDMESEVHRLEQEAYSSVLTAFKAQADAISWEKESLITELRRELRVSDEEHRELLTKVNADETIRKIREWRQIGRSQSNFLLKNQVFRDAVTSPTVLVSHKKQKTSHSIPSLSVDPRSPAMQMQLTASSKQSFTAGTSRGTPTGTKSFKERAGGERLESSSILLSNRSGIPNRTSSGAAVAAQSSGGHSLIGRKVMTRWPDDGNFYEAVICDYNPISDYHALVYDMNTANEAWEWINLKEVAHEDIKWVGDDPRIYQQRWAAAGIGDKSGKNNAIPGAHRVRGKFQQTDKGRQPASIRNDFAKKTSDDIEIASTDAIINEVKSMICSSDLREIEKAKKLLKDHEQSLLDAIAKLGDASEDEHENQLEEAREGSKQCVSVHNPSQCIELGVEGQVGTEVDHSGSRGNGEQSNLL